MALALILDDMGLDALRPPLARFSVHIGLISVLKLNMLRSYRVDVLRSSFLAFELKGFLYAIIT